MVLAENDDRKNQDAAGVNKCGTGYMSGGSNAAIEFARLRKFSSLETGPFPYFDLNHYLRRVERRLLQRRRLLALDPPGLAARFRGVRLETRLRRVPPVEWICIFLMKKYADISFISF